MPGAQTYANQVQLVSKLSKRREFQRTPFATKSRAMCDYSALVQLVRRQALIAFNAHGSRRQLAYRRHRQSRVIVVRASDMRAPSALLSRAG